MRRRQEKRRWGLALGRRVDVIRLDAARTARESARAKIRFMVRRILNEHGYPPDLREEATKLVLEQAQLLCADSPTW